MKFRREEHPIEGGRKLYRYVFEPNDQGQEAGERDNREVRSDATKPPDEPKEEETQ